MGSVYGDHERAVRDKGRAAGARREVQHVVQVVKGAGRQSLLFTGLTILWPRQDSGKLGY